ncbi:MAG: sigma-70 family RNA polymerase sigma factor [Planctomycetes bacterium]|nr:sigma-70 family RNA polymerase sigma factor [Planctomycetota bacterium]
MNEEELKALIEGAAKGESEAEEALYTRYQRFVTRRLTETRSRRNWFWLTDLESAVQDVFVQFFKAVREGKFSFEGEHRLEGFLLRTGFFVAMDRKDRARRDQAISLYDPEEGELRFDVADFADSVYDQLERQRCLQLLAKAIGGLNESRREVIERSLSGQKVREICASMGRSPASISGLKFNACVELRKILGESGFLDQCGAQFGLLGGLS